MAGCVSEGGGVAVQRGDEHKTMLINFESDGNQPFTTRNVARLENVRTGGDVTLAEAQRLKSVKCRGLLLTLSKVTGCVVLFGNGCLKGVVCTGSVTWSGKKLEIGKAHREWSSSIFSEIREVRVVFPKEDKERRVLHITDAKIGRVVFANGNAWNFTLPAGDGPINAKVQLGNFSVIFVNSKIGSVEFE